MSPIAIAIARDISTIGPAGYFAILALNYSLSNVAHARAVSPLLFAIAIEPLSIALKSETRFLGIQRWGMEHKVLLYADDLLLYVHNPESGIPHIMSILNSFRTFSGYKLNKK